MEAAPYCMKLPQLELHELAMNEWTVDWARTEYLHCAGSAGLRYWSSVCVYFKRTVSGITNIKYPLYSTRHM